MAKRTRFLEEVLSWPDAPRDATVILGRIEETARDPRLEEQFDLVTARAFGPPAVTAECAVRFLKVGGVLVVSEPPDDGARDRWPKDRVGDLGLEVLGRVRHGAAYEVLRKVATTSSTYPRPVGVPGKKPLF